jgi:hypothetical protein
VERLRLVWMNRAGTVARLPRVKGDQAGSGHEGRSIEVGIYVT